MHALAAYLVFSCVFGLLMARAIGITDDED